MNEEADRVIVDDIHMDFWSMVSFMVKWAIASIPAALLLLTIATIFLFLINTLATEPLY